jgi:hypothetical protein
MSHVSDIVTMVGRLRRREQAVFALACSERIAPVFRQLASAESVKTYEKISDAAWMSIMSDGRVASAMRGLDVVNGLPEATVDDSLRPEYYAMLSLSVLAYALQALAEDDLPVAINSTCCAAIDVCRNCDFIIAGRKTRKVASGETPSSHGELESAEIVAQNAVLQTLQATTTLSDALCQNIRRMAKETSVQLAQALPRFIQQQGWQTW